MKRILILAAIVALVAAACGGDDDSSADDDGTRTVEIDMVDTAFEPDELQVTEGETIRFVFANTGEVDHDAFVGDADAQADHEAEMRDAEDEGHGGGHGDESEDAITVEPGDTGELTYTFDDTGTMQIGCHQPGHYEDGMKIDVEVA